MASDDITLPMSANARVVHSILEAREFLEPDEAYVAYRKYIGMIPTDDSPWIVTINGGDNQIVDSQHPSLSRALSVASLRNARDEEASKPSEPLLVRLFRRIFC